MATTKERILVTLTPEMARDIKLIAKREKSPKATVAARLMRQALEDSEDRYLAKVAEDRLSSTKRWLSHDAFWKEVSKEKK